MNKATYRLRIGIDAMLLGPQRRRRSMNRALRHLDDLESVRRSRRPRRPKVPAALVVAILVVAGGVLLIRSGGLKFSHLHNISNADSSSAPTGIADAPTTTHQTSTARLLPAPHVTAPSQAYTILRHDRGRVVTWEPCRPIHYVVRRAEEPAAYDALLRDAVADVSRATGLKFISDGSTGEMLLQDPTQRLPYQPREYGDRWAPVLIAWSDASENAGLAGTEAGFAAPLPWAPPGGPERYVSGTVAFNLPDLDTLYARPHGATLVRDVLLHELAHLVGLGHATDKQQVMFPTLTHPIGDFAAGDLSGLASVGTGECYRDY